MSGTCIYLSLHSNLQTPYIILFASLPSECVVDSGLTFDIIILQQQCMLYDQS